MTFFEWFCEAKIAFKSLKDCLDLGYGMTFHVVLLHKLEIRLNYEFTAKVFPLLLSWFLTQNLPTALRVPPADASASQCGKARNLLSL